MVEYYRTIVLTVGLLIQRGRIRGALTRWCSCWQFYVIYIKWKTVELNTCAWNLLVLNKNKESRQVYLSSLIIRNLDRQLSCNLFNWH